MTGQTIAFRRIAEQAAYRTADIVQRWLPQGRRSGREWVARNPTRADNKLGSFKVNLVTGRWAEFAAPPAGGGDLISLAAYLFSLDQAEAAKRVAEMIGIDPYE